MRQQVFLLYLWMAVSITSSVRSKGLKARLTKTVLSLTFSLFLSLFAATSGTFHVDIQIPPEYPFEPPKMKFITEIWHPNVSSQTGAICLDILKDEWSPALSIKTALISLQALLCTPEPNDPQDAEVANMYLSSIETFNATARFWTETYAMASQTEEGVEEDGSGGGNLSQLMEMGFDEETARRALQDHGNDLNAAINSLFG